MKFKLNGNIEIDMDLTLLNPTMELYKVDTTYLQMNLM